MFELVVVFLDVVVVFLVVVVVVTMVVVVVVVAIVDSAFVVSVTLNSWSDLDITAAEGTEVFGSMGTVSADGQKAQINTIIIAEMPPEIVLLLERDLLVIKALKALNLSLWLDFKRP